MRKIPIFSTIVAVAAAAVMVMLGFWQLGRADEKEAMIVASLAAAQQPDPLPWAEAVQLGEAAQYRLTTLPCERVLEMRAVAGRNASGQSGYAHSAICEVAEAGQAEAALGWSREPNGYSWDGGDVTGMITLTGPVELRVTASEPPSDLQPLAQPDPTDLPNNHLAYAGQWFFFAITALVIYWLAIRRRWRDEAKAAGAASQQ
ncbi:hypothetical protein AAV99_06635 [Aurantiacibacter marinus]|uniref:SURF1-like protein n=1 Tax=Aurantiacibacter marinus TaxID=874156 RepID=A0A0H0XPT3_9SPHN|nr:hypothetical protein AAV99_06635 [Aurantiacibacter marinus]